jgi:hypothetical protein
MLAAGQTDTPARRRHFFKANEMNDSKFEAEKIEPAPSMSYAKEQQAAFENYQRLKAERLAREAAADNP